MVSSSDIRQIVVHRIHILAGSRMVGEVHTSAILGESARGRFFRIEWYTKRYDQKYNAMNVFFDNTAQLLTAWVRWETNNFYIYSSACLYAECLSSVWFVIQNNKDRVQVFLLHLFPDTNRLTALSLNSQLTCPAQARQLVICVNGLINRLRI